MSEALVQRTLDGSEASQRTRPGTFAHCPECDEWVLRSRRFDHPHPVETLESAEQRWRDQQAQQKLPDYCELETQTWELTYYHELREVVRVEATSRSDAVEQARPLVEYDGEVTQTLHTEKRPIGDPSPVSVEYLELNGLLPEDHDVTEEDITRVLGGEADA